MKEQILRNTTATLAVTFSTVADGVVRITVTDANGTVVVNNQAATQDGTTSRYTYLLAPQATVSWLTVAWSGTWAGVAQTITTEAEVVGALLFTLAEARAFGDAALQNSSTYPDTLLREHRAEVTELFADYCGISFVPKYGRAKLDGAWRRSLWLPHRKVTSLLNVTIGGVALTQQERDALILYDTGALEQPGCAPWPGGVRQNILVEYEHGYATPPGKIRESAMKLVRYDLTTNLLADRMISFSNDLGVVRQSLAGPDRLTGIHDIDATVNRYREPYYPAAAGY